MINKNELKARLKQGELLGDIFNFTDGQECLIYKGKFEKSDNIIYVHMLQFMLIMMIHIHYL